MHKTALLLAASLAPAFCQCTYQLSQTTASFTATRATSQTINITAPSGCAWISVSNSPWITVSFGQSGTGNGTMAFTVTDNTTPVARTGTLTIAGIAFTVTQAAGNCTYTLTPGSTNLGPGAASGSFTVTTSCTWTAISNSDWLTITNGVNGAGSGTVQFAATANNTAATRTGSITAGGQTFTVTQSGSCGYTLNPVGAQVDASGGSGTFTVTPNSSTGCSWTATSNNPDFIAVTSGASGTANGTVGYTVQANKTQSPRSGSITLGNTTFTIYQPAGQPCSYVLSSVSASFTSSGGSGSFTVTSSCTWSATSSAAWVNVSNSNGTVSFVAGPNSSSSVRSASIMVGSQSFLINQGGVACSVTGNPQSVAIPAAGAAGSLDISAPDGCNWSAVASAAWINLGATSGAGQGSVPYKAAPNPAGQFRTGTITIANQIVTLRQDATVCGQALSPDHATIDAAASSNQFTVSSNCAYTAVSTAGWIKIVSGSSGAAGGAVSYSVSANTSADPRTGTITVGAQGFTIDQSGAGCTLSFSPRAANMGARGGSGSFTVTSSNSCRWEPKTDVGWIHYTYASVNGAGRVNFTVDSSGSSQARSGNIFIADQVFAIAQAGRPALQFDRSGVLNSASFAQSAVAPGEIVTIFGIGIGPDSGTGLQLTGDQQSITTSLGGVQVLFDGKAAPLIYASSTQVSAVVPYAVAGQQNTQLQLEYQGFPSNAIMLDVSPTAPALFTLDTSGAGQGAILNQDSTVNGATNPARRGSVVVLWGTGEGQTIPPGVDGKLAARPLPRPAANVSVQIGGIDATIQYAGGAPGLPAGVLQINAVVPVGVASGALPVVLKAGAAQSPANVTLAVQ